MDAAVYRRKTASAVEILRKKIFLYIQREFVQTKNLKTRMHIQTHGDGFI